MKKTRQEYIRDLQTVQDKVAIMGETARQALHKAMKSLMESDRMLAGEVMKADDAIDDMIIDIEDYCLLLIAKQQPIAHDLRVIATGFKISTDIERIGDHAYDIAKTAMFLMQHGSWINCRKFLRWAITRKLCWKKRSRRIVGGMSSWRMKCARWIREWTIW